MERAFWDALQQGLQVQPWQWQRLAVLVHEASGQLAELIPPRSATGAALLAEMRDKLAHVSRPPPLSSRTCQHASKLSRFLAQQADQALWAATPRRAPQFPATALAASRAASPEPAPACHTFVSRRQACAGPVWGSGFSNASCLLVSRACAWHSQQPGWQPVPPAGRRKARPSSEHGLGRRTTSTSAWQRAATRATCASCLTTSCT